MSPRDGARKLGKGGRGQPRNKTHPPPHPPPLPPALYAIIILSLLSFACDGRRDAQRLRGCSGRLCAAGPPSARVLKVRRTTFMGGPQHKSLLLLIHCPRIALSHFAKQTRATDSCAQACPDTDTTGIDTIGMGCHKRQQPPHEELSDGNSRIGSERLNARVAARAATAGRCCCLPCPPTQQMGDLAMNGRKLSRSAFRQEQLTGSRPLVSVEPGGDREPIGLHRKHCARAFCVVLGYVDCCDGGVIMTLAGAIAALALRMCILCCFGVC